MPKEEYTVTLDAKVRVQLEPLLQRGIHATYQVTRPVSYAKQPRAGRTTPLLRCSPWGATTDARKQLNGSIHHVQRDGVLVGE